MLKRALRVLSLLLLALPGQSFAAGTIAFSLSQQLSTAGLPLSGCLLYTYQAGTTATPQNAYSDTALTQAQPNPMVCDAFGRLPQFFLADGYIKIKLTDKFGVQQIVADNILVIGPSSGSGGGATIDPTTIAATGDLKVSYGTQVITGWVRANGRTIGSSTSGATERANSDTQSLFQYLWSADPNLAVSGGRGASSAADWSANKTIALPDWRGRALAGLDDMGNAAAGRLTATYWGASGGCSGALGTTLGAGCGGEKTTQAQANLPNVNFTISGITLGNGGLSISGSGTNSGCNNAGGQCTGGAQSDFMFTTAGSTGSTTPVSTVTVSAQGTAASGGTATPMATISPAMLATIYVKL